MAQASGRSDWYMSPGIVAESDLSGNLKSEYVFFNGRRTARKDFPGGAVSYYFSDHLKTASVVTDSAGTIKEDEDFYPWGGELQFVNNDSNHYKFTGKERDSETQLDYFGARYYSNPLGRWLTPDWAAKAITVPYANFGDPQTLNLYGYVRGLPTTLVDGDGHDVWTFVKMVVTVTVSVAGERIDQGAAAIAHAMTSGPPSLPLTTLPTPTSCPCPTPQPQNNDSKADGNKWYQQNNEQGRDAQGKFVSKQPGQTQPGSAAEKKALDALGATKNTEKLNGTIRDGTVTETGQHVEVKSGASVSDTQQLQKMGQAAVDATGQPLKVVTTNPNVKVSQPALDNKNLEFDHKP